ncbi:MAG: glycosyltransferase family 4 protein [Deltaproteobacteria bacterium]|nr:glycosyltransferase family 4 protein [Deltaproteobacteria bacterium]
MPKKFLVYQNAVSGGGSKQSLLQIVKLLQANKQFSLQVICTNQGWFSQSLTALGVAFDYLPGLEKLRYINKNLILRNPLSAALILLSSLCGFLRVWAAFYQAKADVLLINEGARELIEFLPFLLFSPKKIVLISQIETELDSGYINRFICWRAHKILAASEAVKEHFLLHGYPEAKILLAPLIVEIKPLKPYDIRSELGITPTESLIVNIASLHPRKGLLDLVEAFALILKAKPDCYLLQMGAVSDDNNKENKSYWEQVQRAISNLGIARKVKFLGWRDDSSAWLNQCSLMLHPTYREGLSRVSVEAINAAIPIISYDLPSMRVLIKHGANGYLVPVGDKSQLAHCSIELLLDSTKLKQLSEIAKKTWENSFSESVTSKATFQALSQI